LNCGSAGHTVSALVELLVDLAREQVDPREIAEQEYAGMYRQHLATWEDD